ncbi:MAG: hypothetical protein IPM18_03835 [Phycisphaerales bacterium]|nr:hypothetical protein [Phycisphaerales bacterium]
MAIVALVSDLFFESKLAATAAAVGKTLCTVRDCAAAEARLANADGLLVDLHAAGDPEALIRRARALRADLPIVAFLSHVEVELAAAARAAGAGQVLPRSTFTQRLPQILAGFAAPSSHSGSLPPASSEAL